MIKILENLFMKTKKKTGNESDRKTSPLKHN